MSAGKVSDIEWLLWPPCREEVTYANLGSGDDNERPDGAVLYDRPSLFQASEAIREGHVAEPQKDDTVTGQSVSKDKVAKILVGGQDDPRLRFGTNQPLGVGCARLDLRSEEHIVTLFAKTNDDGSRDIFIRKEVHAALGVSCEDRFIHGHKGGRIKQGGADVLWTEGWIVLE
jgi:hypothetical protein